MKEKKARKGMKREVAAPSVREALQHLDDMQKSIYDMYVVQVNTTEERDGYVTILVYSWENEETREIYLC